MSCFSVEVVRYLVTRVYTLEVAECVEALELVHNRLRGRHIYLDQRDSRRVRNAWVTWSALRSPEQTAMG